MVKARAILLCNYGWWDCARRKSSSLIRFDKGRALLVFMPIIFINASLNEPSQAMHNIKDDPSFQESKHYQIEHFKSNARAMHQSAENLSTRSARIIPNMVSSILKT